MVTVPVTVLNSAIQPVTHARASSAPLEALASWPPPSWTVLPPRAGRVLKIRSALIAAPTLLSPAAALPATLCSFAPFRQAVYAGVYLSPQGLRAAARGTAFDAEVGYLIGYLSCCAVMQTRLALSFPHHPDTAPTLHDSHTQHTGRSNSILHAHTSARVRHTGSLSPSPA